MTGQQVPPRRLRSPANQPRRDRWTASCMRVAGGVALLGLNLVVWGCVQNPSSVVEDGAVADGASPEQRGTAPPTIPPQLVPEASEGTRIIDEPISPDDWAAADLSAVRRLEILGAVSTETWDWSPLASAPLRRFHLARGGDDRLAAELAGCRDLWLLNLPAATMSERGLRHLAGCPRLRQLRLGGVSISPEIAAELAACPTLRQVHLLDATLSPPALRVLAAAPQLESLYLDRVSVDVETVREIIAGRRDLHVHWNSGHLETPEPQSSADRPQPREDGRAEAGPGE